MQTDGENQDFLIAGIRKRVFILGLVSLFTDMSSEMLYPIVPIFLSSVLGASMTVIGLIEGLAESSSNLLKLISGRISDRTGKRKIFVAAGYSISAISKPVMALAYTWPSVLAARLMDRTGKGIRTSARDALIADSTAAKTMGRSFGFHRSMDTLGAVSGPLIALALLQLTQNNYRSVFLAAFIPGLISIILVIFFVSERRHAAKERIFYNVSQFGRKYRTFLLINVIFALGNSSNVFLILRAKDLGFTVNMAILAYVLFNLVHSLCSFSFGTLSDRLGRRNIMTAGFLVFAGVYFGFAWIEENVYIWPLFVIYGLYEALTRGVGAAYIVDMAPGDKRATALGLYHAATGIMMLFASIIAGLLWDAFGPQMPFIYGGCIAIVSGALLVTVMPSGK